MTHFTRIAIMAGLMSSLCLRPADGLFQDATDGARPAGMGEAFVAVADDANAVLFNPAGYTRLHRFL